jgi:pantoate--beta-alanine ligase
VDEMYARDRVVTVTAAPHDLVFEGAIRPGHFTGVLTVVAKLFHILQPDVAVFGQKDLQQLSLIRRMVRDLDMPVEIAGVPTVRESDGLAMSSRNRYLSPEDRVRAALISASLRAVRDLFERGESNSEILLATGRAVLALDPHISTDYLSLVNPVDFSTVTTPTTGTAIIVAARIGTTRLLDNSIL